MPQPLVPTPAEVARTAAAAARVATLTTFPGRRPVPQRVTAVTVRCDGEGRPVVLLAAGSPAAADLVRRPLAAVTLAPRGTVLHLRGGVERLRNRGDAAGRLAFRLSPGSVRLGCGLHTLDPHDYACAEPDPLRDDAPAVLTHLRRHHAPDLAACLRAHGLPDAEAVYPTQLDRYGLGAAVLGEDGVESVRLPFPVPVRALTELPPSLQALLTCRCQHHRTRATPSA